MMWKMDKFEHFEAISLFVFNRGAKAIITACEISTEHGEEAMLQSTTRCASKMNTLISMTDDHWSTN